MRTLKELLALLWELSFERQMSRTVLVETEGDLAPGIYALQSDVYDQCVVDFGGDIPKPPYLVPDASIRTH